MSTANTEASTANTESSTVNTESSMVNTESSMVKKESFEDKKGVVSLALQNKIGLPGIDEVALKLLRKLQTSLDTEVLLIWFVEGLSGLLGEMNCKLTTRQQEFAIGNIRKARHKTNYNLTLENQILGVIEFSRRKRFSEAELTALETLMGNLIYPLNNALTYWDAVNASMSDALTGAANKRAFDYQLHHQVAISQRYQSSLSFALFDIDFFKKVNDRYGHATGDAVLIQIVEVVKHSCRDSDLVFRLGGEEFGLLLTKTDPQGAYAIADRIRIAISETDFCYNGHKIPVTISMGISTHSREDSKTSFMGRADEALYAAKNTGRNKTIIADESFGKTRLNSKENERVG